VTSQVIIKEDRFPEIIKGMEAAAGKAVRETILDIEGRTKAMMTGPKSGAYYERPNGRTHQASAPGEAPAVDTGNLINSIQTQMTGAMVGVVYTNAEYAPVLEFGGARMAARPFFTPATQAAWPEFLEKMSKVTGG
jgi:phage gpG-like protein